jgi:hypothetical protein
MKDNMEPDYIAFFVVYEKEEEKFVVPTHYKEGTEEKAAWDWINSRYPDADRIERFPLCTEFCFKK